LSQLLGSSQSPWMKTTGVLPEAFAFCDLLGLALGDGPGLRAAHRRWWLRAHGFLSGPHAGVSETAAAARSECLTAAGPGQGLAPDSDANFA